MPKETFSGGEINIDQDAIESFKKELLNSGIDSRTVDKAITVSLQSISSLSEKDPALVNIQMVILMARMLIAEIGRGLVSDSMNESVPKSVIAPVDSPVGDFLDFNHGLIHIYTPSSDNLSAQQIYNGMQERGLNCFEVCSDYRDRILEIGFARVYRPVAEILTGTPVDNFDQRIYGRGGGVYRPNKIESPKGLKRAKNIKRK